MNPTEEQLKARLNPTATTIETPTGGLFTTGGGQTIWGQNAQGQYAAYDVANVGRESFNQKGVNTNNLYGSDYIAEGQRILREKYGLDVNSLTRNDTFNPQALWQANPNSISTTDYNRGSIDPFLSAFGTKASTTSNKTAINTTPNTLATPEQIAQQMKDPNWNSGGPVTQKTFNNGVEVPTAPTPQSIQQGVASITNTGAMIPQTVLQPGATGDSVKKLQDYLVKEGVMTQAQVNTGYGIYGPQTTAAVKALQEKYGVDNTSGPGYFGPKTIQALMGGNKVTPDLTPGALTATGLSGTAKTPITLTPQASTFNPQAVLASADATSKSIQDYMTMLEGPKTSEQTKYDQLTQELMGLTSQMGGRGDAQAEAERLQGVTELKNRLAGVNSEILRKTAEYRALTTDVEGKPITMSSIIGAQAQIQRVMASDIGMLQATALGLQGQLEAAQESANRAVDLKYADVESAINIRSTQLELIKDSLNKQQQNRASAIEMYLQDQQQQLEAAKAEEKQRTSFALDAMSKYPSAGVSASDTYETVQRKITGSREYKAEIARAEELARPSGGSGGISGSTPYANDLDAIVGSVVSTIPTKFGQETFNQQISRSRDDADKINLLAAQVLKGQPAEFKNDFRNQAVGVSMIDKAIAEIDSGVQTGLINNAAQYTYNLLGKDFDPKLAKIQGYITSAIQPYRNSVTGAAWGDQEDAEYQQLFGSTKYSPAELRQRLVQTKELLKAKSAQGLNSFVNPMGTYDNVFETGTLGNTPISTQDESLFETIANTGSGGGGFFSDLWKGITGQ